MDKVLKDVYDDDYENTLPAELMQDYHIIECFSHRADCDTLLVMHKTTGRRLVAKCYMNTSALYERGESILHDGIACPAIPRFIGEFKNEMCRCVLREYIEGTTLDEFIKSNSVTERDITDMAIKLADIMRIMHESEPAVIHRDIKPKNIIVRKDGTLALIDFGISRLYKAGEDADTVLSGTADFAAPEQYGFMQTDIRSDMYSYGIVLAWMLTGRAKPIRKPASDLERVAARCSAFSPDRRYKDDAALIGALRRTTPEYKKRVRIRRTVAAAACLLVAAVLSAGILLHRASIRDRIVTFREPLIEEAVRLQLDRKWGDITYEDLKEITDIYIFNDCVFTTYLEWNEYMVTWYEQGDVRGTLTDISDLKNMPNLKGVYIGGEHISDITPLRELELLESIDLRGNDVEDISPLAYKKYLTAIGFNDNRLKSIDTVSTCPMLSVLDLNMAGSFDGSPIRDIAQFSFLDICCDSDAYLYLGDKSFDILCLGAPGQTDLACIRDVRRIESLYLYSSEITDISALAGRDDISSLRMSQGLIEDLSPLFSMSALRTVELAYAMKDDMEELAAIYGEPDFEVIYVK